MFEFLKLSGAAAAMMASAGTLGDEPANAPIYLVTESVQEGLRVRVMGASGARLEASFSLEVTGNGNRSLHRGSATLNGGEAVTLSTVTLGNAALGAWRAQLRVEPSGGEAYEQVRDSL